MALLVFPAVQAVQALELLDCARIKAGAEHMKSVKMDKYALIQLVDSAMPALRSEFTKQNTEKGSDGLRITPFGAANANECCPPQGP